MLTISVYNQPVGNHQGQLSFPLLYCDSIWQVMLGFIALWWVFHEELFYSLFTFKDRLFDA